MTTKNLHMTHIEDKVIYGGVDGTRQAINALRSLRDMLKGSHKGKVTVKWDGAPSIFAGIDPADGQFFVAKKSIFNKNPKVYKTEEDIDADTQGDLALKFKAALKLLPHLGIKGVVQGDFLFGPGDLKKQVIDGDKYVTFHPNTIVYAVPDDTSASREVQRAEIGIVWHTSYTGSSFEDMKASYDVDVTKFKRHQRVWSIDASLEDCTDLILSAKETDQVDDDLSEAGKLFKSIQTKSFNAIKHHDDFPRLIEQYTNSLIRDNKFIGDVDDHVDGLKSWIEGKFKKEIDKRKTEKGKQVQQEKLDDILSFFDGLLLRDLKNMFELQKVLVSAKLKLINILDKLNKVKTFVKTKNGFKVTGSEGYVAIDTLNGGAVKIVNRLEFSYNNFSPNILKGWDKPERR